jgi:hypothetical protein
VELKDNNGFTALHLASRKGRLDCAELLAKCMSYIVVYNTITA